MILHTRVVYTIFLQDRSCYFCLLNFAPKLLKSLIETFTIFFTADSKLTELTNNIGSSIKRERLQNTQSSSLLKFHGLRPIPVFWNAHSPHSLKLTPSSAYHRSKSHLPVLLVVSTVSICFEGNCYKFSKQGLGLGHSL